MYLKHMRGQMKVVEFRKTESKKINADDVLENLKTKLENVLVIGTDKNSDEVLHISSNMDSKSSMIYLLEQLKLQILIGGFDAEEDN